MLRVVRDRLGFPHTRGRRRLLAGLVIDSLGTGLFVPFQLVYLLATTSLTLTEVGVAFSLAAGLALPVGLVAGPLVDRVGSKHIVVASNIVQAVAFVLLPLAVTLWHAVPLLWLAAAGRGMFWTANGALVARAADPGEQSRWFGMEMSLRNAGIGVGGLLAAAAAGLGGTVALHALVLGNAVSFFLAGIVTASWRPASPAATLATGGAAAAGQEGAARYGYRTVLTDRPYIALTLTNVAFVFAALALPVLLAVYIEHDLGAPVWLTGMLFSLNTAVVAGGAVTAAKVTQWVRRTGTLRVAAGGFGVSFLAMWSLTAVPGWAVVPGLCLAVGIYSAAETVEGPTMRDLATSAAPEAIRGRYLALHQLSWRIGESAAPAALTYLLARGSAWPWLALTAACAIGALALTRLGRTLPPHAEYPRAEAAERSPSAAQS